jgi:hypothetical protein
MDEVPAEIRAVLSDAEIAEVAAHPVTVAAGTESNAIELAVAWDRHVRKIDSDRALPRTDRQAWTEHDLAGALFLRDRVEHAVDALPAPLALTLRGYLDPADERFRSCTVDDSGERMARVAVVDVTGRAWWWFRVPDSGPIAEDLAQY